LTGKDFRPDYLLPTDGEVTSFQNRLFSYRLLNNDKIAVPNLDLSGFRPEICVMADVLAAPIVDDPELRTGVIELLKDRDEQSRVDRATADGGAHRACAVLPRRGKWWN